MSVLQLSFKFVEECRAHSLTILPGSDPAVDEVKMPEGTATWYPRMRSIQFWDNSGDHIFGYDLDDREPWIVAGDTPPNETLWKKMLQTFFEAQNTKSVDASHRLNQNTSA